MSLNNINMKDISDLIENDKITKFYPVELINGMLFLILIISSNFVGDLLNCKYQRVVINNAYIKHLIAFFILYFTNTNLFIDNKHPIDRLINCIILYIIFIMIMRLNILFTIITLFLLFVIHFIHQYYLYYKNNSEKIKNYNNVIVLHQTIRILSIITLIITVLGVIINYHERKKEYGKNFKIINFILGNVICDNLDKKII